MKRQDGGFSVDWGFIAVLVMLLIWFYPKPTDLLDSLSRAPEIVRSLLPDAPITVAYPPTPRCAPITQSNAARVFDDMNVSDCGSGLRVALSTSLTPGTGELRFNLASASVTNATHANGSTQRH